MCRKCKFRIKNILLVCSVNLLIWAACNQVLAVNQVEQQYQNQQQNMAQFVNTDNFLTAHPSADISANQTFSDPNRQFIQLDYSTLIDDDELPLPPPASQEARLLWRRQVQLLSEDGIQLDSPGMESLVAPNQLPDYYDSYRPMDFSTLASAGLLQSEEVRTADASASDAQQSAFARRIFVMDSKQSGASSAGAKSNGDQFQQQQQQQQKIGPQFIKEPPSFIHYLNSSDLVIPCSASGNPQPTISWWHKSFQLEVGSLLDKRYVRYDNSLVISAFKAHDYEPDIHSTVYKCQASNALGTIVSRDVVINAVIDQDYEVSVGDQFVTVDNDALFKCQIAPQTRDIFQITGWLEDGQHLIQGHISGQQLLSGQQQQQRKSARYQQQRAMVLPDGQLYIQRVQLNDANKSYRCQIKNMLNSKVSLSSLSGRLFVTDANEQSGTSPRIIDAPKPISVAKLNDQLLLTCLAQGSPRPTIRWFRQSGQKYQQLDSSSNQVLAADWQELSTASTSAGAGVAVSIANQSAADSSSKYVILYENNLLLIKSLQLADNRARFKCLANNTFGIHFAETEVKLDLWPQSKLVELEPKVEFIHNGDLQRQSVTFNCTIRASGQPLVAIEWLKNGRQLFSISLPQYASGQYQLELATTALSANGSSLFDDLNQELSAIEYYFPPAASDEEQHQHQEQERQQQQQQPNNNMAELEPDNLQQSHLHHASSSNFILTSSTLNKLLAASTELQSSGAPSIDSAPLSGRQSRARLRQRVRPSNNKDQLVYQLQLDQLRRSDRGSYQCRAHQPRTSFHATSQLMLKDNPPQFVETFSSQLLTKAHLPQASLKCVASGSPLPEISWTLSGFPVPESSRFRVGDYVTRDGLIVSFVNISNVQVEDGGLYECSATNDVGQLKHLAWLNVTGPAYIRPMPNVSAIEGNSLAIMCPVGGWPIEQITWFQNSSKLPVNHRQKLFPNGTMIINELNEVTDSGRYSCQAKSVASSNDDTFAINHVQVSIKVPPVVEPFSFAKSLHRGQRYNIMCTVVRGDLPVAIRWFKDGRQIEQPDSMESTGGPQNPARPDSSASGGREIAIKHLDPYSSTLTFASLQSHHRGLYSCEATNEAGRASQSSALVIHVPPEWKIEPKDLSVTVGKTAVIDCQADAFPAARIEWRLSQDLFREPPTEFKPIISSLYMRVFENGSLIIYNTQRTDAGYYLCQANNGVGPGLSRVIKLTVHVAAHFKAKIRTELVRRGQPARLKCESIGDLPIEISWLRDKMPLYATDEPRYSLSKTMLQDGIVSELNIAEADRTDSALFTCITQNQYGNDDTNIQLIVQGTPDPPLDIRIHEYEARSVKISWLPAYSGNSPISKYIIMYALTGPIELGLAAVSSAAGLLPASTARQSGQSVVGAGATAAVGTSWLGTPTSIGQYVNVSVAGNESSITLQGLTPLSEYQFYMFAINSLGSSRIANEPIKFRTDDEAPADPPLFVKAQTVSSHSIRVKWRAPERRTHFGSVSGFYVGYKLQPVVQQQRSVVAGSDTTSSNGGSGSNTPDTFIYKTVEFQAGSSQHGGSSVSTDIVKSQLEQECLLLALLKGQKYLIIVQAFNSRGAGPASEPIVTETWRVDVPDPPSLRMVIRNTHSIHLAWRLANSNANSIQNQLVLDQQAAPLVQTSQAGSRPLQQAALMMRKSINDHIKSYQFGAATEIDLLESETKRRAILTGNSLQVPPSSPLTHHDQDQEQNLNSEQDHSGLQMTDQNDIAQTNEPILGFILTRKPMLPSSSTAASAGAPATGAQIGGLALENQSQLIETRLPSDHLSHIVDNLTCGTRYQFTIVALNLVGASAPSEPLIVKTEGSTPVAPDKSSLLSMNSSSVLINLGAWHNGACAMHSFDIMFKASRSKKWTPLTNYQVSPLAAMVATAQDQARKQSLDGNGSRMHEFSGPANQLAQRSTYSQQFQQQLVQANPNSTIVLDDLSSALNYDLKILATNEAGSTEAMYTFNINGGSLNGVNRAGGEQDHQWAAGGEFQFADTGLPELFSGSGPLLTWLLFLLFVSLTLSTGCILVARRKQASLSSCSLSLSSASRSNQSSSNYYTAPNISGNNLQQQRLESTKTTVNGSYNQRCQALAVSSQTSNGAAIIQKPNQHQLEDSPMLHGNQNIIHLGDIYGQRQSLTGPTHLSMMDKSSNYAYLSSQQQHRPASPHNTDITSVINGSETEMCLGASALNIAPSQQQQQLHSEPQAADQQILAPGKQRSEQGYYVAPMLSMQLAKSGGQMNQSAVSQLSHLGKSSTLPANYHQQIIQQLIQQQQQQQNDSNQQQMIDTLMAANILQQQQQQQQQQQCGETYLAMQAGRVVEETGPINMAALLEQQLQQQVYATVKRGCPRPPRLCDYTIYQCPNQPDQQQEAGQQLSMLATRCCGELQPPVSSTEQQHLCYHQIDQQTCIPQPQQPQHSSDYQQLRPVN